MYYKSKSKFDSIGDILSRFFAKNPEAKKKIKQYSLFAVWNEIVGERVAKHAQPLKMIDNTLVVRVDQSSWMHELQLMKPELLRRIHGHVEAKLIRDIRLEIGKVEE